MLWFCMSLALSYALLIIMYAIHFSQGSMLMYIP